MRGGGGGVNMEIQLWDGEREGTGECSKSV